MSIKEAIERGPMVRERKTYTSWWGEGSYSDRMDQELEADEVNRLRGSGILGVLSELAEVIRESHQDVQLSDPEFFGTKDLHVNLMWNFRKSDERGPVICSAIYVIVPPWRREILIGGQGEREALTKSQWTSEIIEDAVIRAYLHPGVYLSVL